MRGAANGGTATGAPGDETPIRRVRPASPRGKPRCRALVALAAGAALLAACARPAPPAARFEPASKVLAGARRDPSVAVAPSGRVLVLAPRAAAAGEPGGLALWSSEDGGDSYREIHRLGAGGEVESHGEGRPLLRAGPAQEHYALWSESGDGGKRLRLARSLDHLRSFSEPGTLAFAGAAGFFDLAVAPDGALVLAWLAYDPPPGALPGTAALRLAVSRDRGASWSEPVLAAKDVCPCCRPRLAFGGGAGFLAWRGVAEGNVRDVVVARSADGFATLGAPAVASADGWRIEGCPHAGPSLAVSGERLWVAWATGASGALRAYAASSALDRTAFASRTPIGASLADAHHPEVVATPAGAWVTFQAREGGGGAGLGPARAWVARLDEAGASAPIAAPTGEGSALYPQAAGLEGDKLLLAWTESGEGGPAVRTARARLAR